jgi:hypothetical protein
MKVKTEEEKWFLSMHKEVKLDLLNTALEKGEFGHFFQMVKILLDAPISEGGISTEEIEAIRKKHF